MLLLFLVLVINGLNSLQNKKQVLDQLKLDTVNAIDQPWKVELEELKNEINELKNNNIDKTYPIGSIYISASATNPKDVIGGIWERYGEGRTLIGVGTGKDSNNVSKEFLVNTIGGEYNHTLTIDEMPSHKHAMISWMNRSEMVYGEPFANGKAFSNVAYRGDGSVQRANDFAGIDKAGGSQSHNNIQPYIAVYMWKRIS